MAEQRVTGQRLSDVTLTHWEAEAKKEPPGKLGSINLPAVVEMLIAEVRASRVREAELADEVDRLVELDRIHVALCARFGAERDVLQQRIDKALAWLPGPGVAADADAIRAALAGAAESHRQRSGGTGTPTGPVSGGGGQDSGQEAAEDDEAERTVAKFRAAVPDHLDEVRRRVHHAQRPCDAVLPLIAELRQARAELARYRASDA